MEYGFEPLDSEEAVLSIPEHNERSFFISHPMFKLGELLKKMNAQIIGINIDEWHKDDAYRERKKWHNEGVNCEILQPGGNWKKGKVRIRISLEFCPDEPKSMFDDIRQSLKAPES